VLLSKIILLALLLPGGAEPAPGPLSLLPLVSVEELCGTDTDRQPLRPPLGLIQAGSNGDWPGIVAHLPKAEAVQVLDKPHLFVFSGLSPPLPAF
jgi:hypothetical protein